MKPCYRITPDLLKSMGLSDFAQHILGIKVTDSQRSILNAFEYGRSPCLHLPRSHYKTANERDWFSGPPIGNHFNALIADDLISNKAFNNIIKEKEDKMMDQEREPNEANRLWVDPTKARTNPLEVIIKPAENGLIVKVGCATFVFENWHKAQQAIGEYFKDPEKAANKYYYKKEKK